MLPFPSNGPFAVSLQCLSRYLKGLQHQKFIFFIKALDGKKKLDKALKRDIASPFDFHRTEIIRCIFPMFHYEIIVNLY